MQVTWETNRRKFGATKPGQLMTWPIALRATFDGMTKGMFTGKKLADHINGEKCAYVGARRLVNGTDRDDDLAAYSKTFEAGFRAANYLGVAPQPRLTILVESITPSPSIPKASEPKTSELGIPPPNPPRALPTGSVCSGIAPIPVFPQQRTLTHARATKLPRAADRRQGARYRHRSGARQGGGQSENLPGAC